VGIWDRLRGPADATRLEVLCVIEGGTREGRLRIEARNAGERATRGLTMRLAWSDGTEDVEARRQPLLPELAPGASETWLVDDLQLDMPEPRSRWRALVIKVGAANAPPEETRFDLRLRGEPNAAYAARYASPPCPATSDGSHRFVVSHPLWEACANCRYARRLPRTLAQDAREQAEAAARRAQVAREEKEREARERHREAPPPRREAPPPPPREPDDEMPLAVARHLLRVAPGATLAEVEAAYRKLAMRLHPDRVATSDEGTREALTELMADLNRARERLRRELAR